MYSCKLRTSKLLATSSRSPTARLYIAWRRSGDVTSIFARFTGTDRSNGGERHIATNSSAVVRCKLGVRRQIDAAVGAGPHARAEARSEPCARAPWESR